MNTMKIPIAIPAGTQGVTQPEAMVDFLRLPIIRAQKKQDDQEDVLEDLALSDGGSLGEGKSIGKN